MHGSDSLDTLCEKWSYRKVCILAISMQDQMFPDSKSVASPQTTTQKAGFQSGETEKRLGRDAKGREVKMKTTNISFGDMAARAKAGIDTSIKGI